MSEVSYSVVPVQGGWAIEQKPAGQPLMFLGGGRAEAKARQLAEAAWRLGQAAEVLIHTRDGQLVGRWRYGAEPVETPVA